MKLTKRNICVLIENEEQLQQAREILIRCGERVETEPPFEYGEDSDENKHIYYMEIRNEWCYYYGAHKPNETPIPLSELESVIKN